MLPNILLIFHFLFSMGMSIPGYSEGTLAYWHQVNIEDVCWRRVREGWNPQLNCDYPCLISGIEPEHVGEYWLIALPNCRGKIEYRLCLVVDCARSEDINRLRARNEVVEISGGLARYCGYQDYVDDVMVWRLGDEYRGSPQAGYEENRRDDTP